MHINTASSVLCIKGRKFLKMPAHSRMMRTLYQCFFICQKLAQFFFSFKITSSKRMKCSESRVPSRLECMCACMLSRFSHVCLCNTVGCSPPGSFVHGGFSRQEYWRGLPCPSPGDLPKPGMEPMSLMPPATAGGFFRLKKKKKTALLRYTRQIKLKYLKHALWWFDIQLHCERSPFIQLINRSIT